MQKNYKELLLDKMKEQSLEFNEQNKKKDFIKEINPKIISDFTIIFIYFIITFIF